MKQAARSLRFFASGKNSKASKKVVAVAISGGVDSSVAALLLKRQGYTVIGVHMTNWNLSDETGTTACQQTDDIKYANEACKQLDIPLKHVSFEQEYWSDVFEPLIDGYSKGCTPNPDVWCNRAVKFKPLLQFALGELRADYLATGHYARLAPPVPTSGLEDGMQQYPRLLTAVDKRKDQTHFLSCVPGHALSHVLFPIGGLKKDTGVRHIANEAGLINSARRDSQGICFIGKRQMGQFLQKYLDVPEPGPIVTYDGKIIGEHPGLFHFTIGQKARIGGSENKWFVSKKDIVTNRLICVPAGHQALFTHSFEVRSHKVCWVSENMPTALSRRGLFRCFVRIRHGADLSPCTLTLDGEGIIRVYCPAPLKAVTEKQIAAFYIPAHHADVAETNPSTRDFVCLGGVPIDEPGPPISAEAASHLAADAQINKTTKAEGPRNGWRLFLSDFFDQNSVAGLTASESFKIAGLEWNRLSDETKLQYRDRAKANEW